MSDRLPGIRRMTTDKHGGHWPPSPTDVDWMIAEIERVRRDRESLRQEVERLQTLRADELPLQWPCGCGFARAKVESIDSGTVLCCEECGRQVVVRLEAIEEGEADPPRIGKVGNLLAGAPVRLPPSQRGHEKEGGTDE